MSRKNQIKISLKFQNYLKLSSNFSFLITNVLIYFSPEN